MVESIHTVLTYFILGLLTIIFVYALVRSASWAYFRTRLEYLRQSLKEMTNHDGDR